MKITSGMTRIACKVAANPDKALAAAAGAVPVIVETAVAVAPIALVGAAGYGLYRLVKWVAE